MRERILQFLKEESLTAAKFADDIGVQRSSVSHILSGRNNPGFDFIQKMLKGYPQLNAEWLIMGTGNIFKPVQQASLFDFPGESPVKQEPVEQSQEGTLPKAERPAQSSLNLAAEDLSTDSIPGLKKEADENTDLSIEKIIILYKNNTFRQYLPGK